MTWVKIDPRMTEHPKIVGLSDRAFRLHINALCYAGRNDTDGRISRAVLRQLGGTARHAGELVAAKVWEVNGAGWAIHDYLHFNFSKAQIEQQRQEARARMDEVRKNKRRTRREQ